jgi:hypothetical protein
MRRSVVGGRPGRSGVYIRGSVIQRVFAHDVYHCAELNEMLATLGLPLVDFWD